VQAAQQAPDGPLPLVGRDRVGVKPEIARARSLRQNATMPERVMWGLLRELKSLGFHFRRQVPIGRYFADFACHTPGLVIEVDGDTHGSDAAQAYDGERDRFLQDEGYVVVRVSNRDVMDNRDGVGRLIVETLESLATPTLSLPTRGRGPRGASGNSQDAAKLRKNG
jgi:very-short-patch-repair endonuclease